MRYVSGYRDDSARVRQFDDTARRMTDAAPRGAHYTTISPLMRVRKNMQVY